jgi:hypothetical protein
MLYGDEHLINVAHTYRHLPEEVEQQKQSENDLDKFFHDHVEGYTQEQHSLISDIWDAEHRVERELGGMNGLSYEERQAKLTEIMPQETQLPKEVYLAAKELGENRSTYSDWHKDNYGHRPHGDAEWGISKTEIHPFGGVPYADYIDAFKNSPAMQKAKNEFFTEHIAGHTLEQYQLADTVKNQQEFYKSLHGPHDTQGMEDRIVHHMHIPHLVYQEINSFNSAREQYQEKFSVPAGPQNTPQSLQEWGVSPIEIKPFAKIPLKDNNLAYQLEQQVGLDISDPLVYHTKQMFSDPKIPSLTDLLQDAKANLPHPKHPSEIRTPSADGFSRHMSEGWKPLKDATIEGDGYKVEFSRYADKTIDPMCDALNGWHYAWQNDFNCTYTDSKGKLELRLDKPEDADRLFDIMTNIQPVTFEHEGSMTATEVARAGMEAMIQFLHPEQAKQAQPAPQAQASQPQASEKKDFSQLKTGEYEIVQDKKGIPYIHGKPDFEGAPSEVYFKQTYGAHELTDMETKSLLKGNEISVPVRSGNAQVKLGEGQINGHQYFGIQRTDQLTRSRRLPDTPETSSPAADKQIGDN